MAERMDGAPVGGEVDVDELGSSEDLDSLIRSVGRDATKYYLDRAYSLATLKAASVADLVNAITNHVQRDEMLRDLSRIRTYSRGVNEETFLDLARAAGVTYDFGAPLKHIIVDFLLLNPVALDEAYVHSEIRWQVGCQEFQGKSQSGPAAFSDTMKNELADTLRSLISGAEPGRKCVVNVKQAQQEVLLAAYIQQRRKEFYTIGAGDRVAVEVVTPAARTAATYDISKNRLRVKAGPSKRLLRYISEAFGKALYGDNSFFSDPEQPVIYNLAPLREPAFRIELDEALPQVTSARVTEETLRFMVGEQQVIVTYQADDVEAILPALSNEQMDLTVQERVSATIELQVVEGERTKIVPIRVIRGNKIEFDPRYAEVVHHLLQKWGLEFGG